MQNSHFKTDLEIFAMSDPRPPSGFDLVEMDLPRIKIFAFGRPVVLIDGKPIEHWRMARAMELFYFLLTIEQPISKEEIMTALWPEYDDQTKQTFHSTLHYLRKLLGKSSLIFYIGGYMLNLTTCYGNSISYDVWEFQRRYKNATQSLANENVKAAKDAFLAMVAIYQGDYGQPFYNDWCTHLRDELRIIYMEALRQLALIAWNEQAFNESIKHWRYMLQIDNCLEEAHYGIMRCYMRQNRRSAALHQYQRCKETLQIELNIEPDPAIQKLYSQLTKSSESMNDKISHVN